MKSEKASDALWNLLLGILDKATLTLGDGRRNQFLKMSHFYDQQPGQRPRMQNLVQPRWGFATPAGADTGGGTQIATKLSAVGTAAARRKFTPEFVNRLDAMVVFHALGEDELPANCRDRIAARAATYSEQRSCASFSNSRQRP